MAEINWGLGQNNGAQNAFQTGFQLGDMLRQRNAERKTSNALSGLVANPQQDDAQFAQTIQGLPAQAASQLIQARQGYQRNAAQQQQAQTEQRRADIPLLTRLVETSTDEASYQRNRQVAQQYGVDLSGAPAQFDPAWRDQQLVTLKAIQTPGGQEALSTAGKQAVDMGYRPGTPEFNGVVRDIFLAGESKPYVVGGETKLYTPRIGGAGETKGGPQPGAVIAGFRFKGGNPNDRGSWEPVQGGPTQPASAGFRPPVNPAIQGNLPTDIRNRVKNRDGSVSTVRTMSIGTDQGEVLIPTVIGNRVVSDDEAIRHYQQTGENFGVFKTPDEATAYAKALHNYHEALLRGGASSNASGGFRGQ